jgi:hypothetical protein
MPNTSALPRHVYVVMPPAHGKSVLHQQRPHLYEMDQVVPTRETHELDSLRSKAWSTGDWADYDKVYSKAIKESLPEFALVMVPAKEIGENLNASFLGACYLESSVWERNFSDRKGDTEKYRTVYEAAKAIGKRMETNQETTEFILSLYDTWVSTVTNPHPGSS